MEITSLSLAGTWRTEAIAFGFGLLSGLLAAIVAFSSFLLSHRRSMRRRRQLLEETPHSVNVGPGSHRITPCVSNTAVVDSGALVVLDAAEVSAASAANLVPVGVEAAPEAVVTDLGKTSCPSQGATPRVPHGSSSAVGCFDLLSSWGGSRKRQQRPLQPATRPETALASRGGDLVRKAIPTVGEELSDEDLLQLYLAIHSRIKNDESDTRLLRTPGALKSTAKPLLLRPLVAEGEVHKDAPWLNSFIALLWPKISEHVKGIHRAQKGGAAGSVKIAFGLEGDVRFDEVTLGSTAPDLSDFMVYRVPAEDTVQLRAHLCLKSDLKASVVAAGARVTISNLTLDGEVSFVFSPLAAKPPYFGGLEIYFVNPPVMSFEIGGNVIPHGLQPAIRSAVADVFAKFLVQPNRIAVDLDQEAGPDATDLKHPDPLAVLRLTLLRGSGLRAADTSVLGTKSSDPYVVISFGATRWTSPTKRQTLAPVWATALGEPSATIDIPVHCASQLARFEVYDADLVSSDLIGGRSDVQLGQLLGTAAGAEVAVELLDAAGTETAGSIFVSTRLLYLGTVPRPLPAAAAIGGPSGAYLCMKILEVQGLPSDSQYPFKVRMIVGAKHIDTRSSHIKANKHVSAAMESVCIEQLGRGRSPALLAEALGLKLNQVLALGQAAAPTQQDVQQAVKEAVALRAATDPWFEEAVQLLIPDPAVDGSCCKIVLQLLDKHGAVLGSARVAMAKLLGAPDLELTGRVLLQPV
eukprot:CAMPEP_0115382982 /NCGR_PEP_ID=MMETSP0271-20121206/6362_1 /TAXON_ID=71861 /ORGANISM="Scrippsiella trochoidea, Strain CCMP3099" /LENGTH=748 /DNA_ID=CAMNT_0002806301 /DNA_START=45 /DNA_END=2289 /DNA_ORIENTATION=+